MKPKTRKTIIASQGSVFRDIAATPLGKPVMTADETYQLGYADAYGYLDMFNLGTVRMAKFYLQLSPGVYEGLYYDGFCAAVRLMEESGVENKRLTVNQIKQSWKEMDK